MTRLPTSSPALAWLAAPWLLLAAIDLVLQLVIPGAGLRNDQVPIGARLGFAALDLLVLALVTVLIGLVLAGVDRLARPAVSSLTRGGLVAARAGVVGGAALLYVASWATFWNTGNFLDREAFAFWIGQPIQIFHWVYPPLVIGLLLTVVLLSGTVVFGSRAAVRQSPSAQHSLVLAASVLLTACVAASLASGTLYGWSDLLRSPSPYSVARAGHAGPIVHALVDAGRRLTPTEQVAAPAEATNPDGIVRRPIVSIQEYLARVDPLRRRSLNVVMVQVESLRADQLRAYGGTRDVMPAVDAVAREGRVFTNAYIQASHSNYADLVPLSSQYPLRSSSMYTFPENPPYPRVLIYDVLKALGYRTGIFSSQNEGWGGMINFHRPSALDRFFHAQTFNGPTYAPWEDTGFSDWVKQTGSAGSVDDRYTISEAMQWLDSIGSQPFFMHLNLQSSHLPYVVPTGFTRPFGPPTLDFTIMWGKFPLDRIGVVKDRYADSLYYADTQIARLFDHLRAKGLWENTLVVIGGDNGEAFFEHGFAAHATWLFNEVVKVPMIVRAPGLPAGADDRPAMFLDVPPSIVDLLGLPPHPGFQGISLFAANPDPNRSMFMIAQTPSAYETAVVRGRYKLHFAEVENSYFLNDLVADPGETTDVGARLPDVVKDLSSRIQRWREAQLAYYSDIPRQQREYPPVFLD